MELDKKETQHTDVKEFDENVLRTIKDHKEEIATILFNDVGERLSEQLRMVLANRRSA